MPARMIISAALETTQSLEGRVVLVTGASSGQGHAFALGVARRGAKVFAVARREDRLRDLVARIGEAGGDAAYHVTDVRSVPAVYDLVDVVLARYRHIDVLINAAGVGYRAPLADMKRVQIAETLETDLAGAIYLTQAALPSLIKSAPSDIVNVASIAGLEGFPEGSVYCAAKHGLVGFTRALAAEVKPEGVRVTALCSGSVDTEFFDRFRPTTEKEKRLRTDDVLEALLGILTSPAHVLHGEVVLRPRVV
ncbi:MAG: SDR family oxidoreductase [Acidobacteriota bacterium]|nr:SDR family oxidoreductase [Acidobacteriota bacterium]